MKLILFAVISLATISSFAKQNQTVDEDASAIEALNTYCTSSTQIYQNQIQNIKNQTKTGSISDSDLEKAIDALASLRSDINTHCE